MDCSKCLDKCKAECCSVVPFEKDRFYRNKRVREILELTEFDGIVIPTTKDGKCPFLGHDLQCTIYDDRPDVCRKFGDESHILMTCAYQDKDGRVRSRQERRQISRQHEKIQTAILSPFAKP